MTCPSSRLALARRGKTKHTCWERTRAKPFWEARTFGVSDPPTVPFPSRHWDPLVVVVAAAAGWTRSVWNPSSKARLLSNASRRPSYPRRPTAGTPQTASQARMESSFLFSSCRRRRLTCCCCCCCTTTTTECLHYKSRRAHAHDRNCGRNGGLLLQFWTVAAFCE